MPAHGVVNGLVIVDGNRLVDVDQLEKDALRYRWLRDVGDATWQPFSTRIGTSAEHIDAAIDKALAKKS